MSEPACLLREAGNESKYTSRSLADSRGRLSRIIRRFGERHISHRSTLSKEEKRNRKRHERALDYESRRITFAAAFRHTCRSNSVTPELLQPTAEMYNFFARARYKKFSLSPTPRGIIFSRFLPVGIREC